MADILVVPAQSPFTAVLESASGPQVMVAPAPQLTAVVLGAPVSGPAGAGFLWRGPFALGQDYAVNDVVQVGAWLYLCTSAVTAAASYPNVDNRFSVFVKGQRFVGTWVANTQYFAGDVVYDSFQTSAWVALVDQQNANHPSAPSWGEIAADGVAGSGFQWRGTWAGNQNYVVNDVTLDAGTNGLYICTVQQSAGVGSSPSTYPSHWNVYLPAGQAGTNGSGTFYAGAWSNTTAYFDDGITSEVVLYNSALYVTLSGAGSIPAGTLPTNATYWQLYLPAGQAGAPGPSPTYGLLSARPASATDKTLYVATDVEGGTIYQYQSTAWVKITAGVNAALIDIANTFSRQQTVTTDDSPLLVLRQKSNTNDQFLSLRSPTGSEVAGIFNDGTTSLNGMQFNNPQSVLLFGAGGFLPYGGTTSANAANVILFGGSLDPNMGYLPNQFMFVPNVPTPMSAAQPGWTSFVFAKCQSSGTTAKEFFLDGSALRTLIRPSSIARAEIIILGVQSTQANDWSINQVVRMKRIGTGNVAFSYTGPQNAEGTAPTDGVTTWTITLAANTADQSLKISVKGNAGQTINWHLFIRFSEAGF